MCDMCGGRCAREGRRSTASYISSPFIYSHYMMSYDMALEVTFIPVDLKYGLSIKYLFLCFTSYALRFSYFLDLSKSWASGKGDRPRIVGSDT